LISSSTPNCTSICLSMHPGRPVISPHHLPHDQHCLNNIIHHNHEGLAITGVRPLQQTRTYSRFDLSRLLRCIHHAPTPPCTFGTGSNRLQGSRVFYHVSVRDNSVQTSRVCSMQTDKCRVFTGFDSKVQLKVRAPNFVCVTSSFVMYAKHSHMDCKRRKTCPFG
jgi:hypothetical protein